MRYIYYFLTAVLIALVPYKINANAIKPTTNTTPIPIKEIPKGKPRDLVITPTSHYNNGKIIVQSEDWTFAEVIVTHTCTNAQFISSGYLDDIITVDTGGIPGFYTITVITESGAEFYGEFTL